MIVNVEKIKVTPPYQKGVTSLEDFITDQHSRRLVTGYYERKMQVSICNNPPYVTERLPKMKKCCQEGCPNMFNHVGIACSKECFDAYTSVVEEGKVLIRVQQQAKRKVKKVKK